MASEAGRMALFVIDVQQALFEKTIPIHKAEALLANILWLADAARAAGAPVVFVQHSDKRALAAGSAGWQLHPALRPQADDLCVAKTHPNAFDEASLHSTLKGMGVSHVVVCGLVTHGCVRATCQGAQAHGYQVTLAADAHSSYNKDAAALIEEWNSKLAAAGILVLPSAQVAFTPIPDLAAA